MSDPLQCTYEDARRNHLRAGIALSTAAKVAYFEEMVSLIRHFGATDRLAVRDAEVPGYAPAEAKVVGDN